MDVLSSDLLSWLFTFGLLILGGFALVKFEEHRVSAREQANAELRNKLQGLMDAWNAKVNQITKSVTAEDPVRWDRQDALVSGVGLQKNETVLIKLPAMMARSVKVGSTFKAGTASTRVRIAKGISVGFGGTKGSSVARYDHQSDMGWLYLTTKRIVFDGVEHDNDFAVPLPSINAVTLNGEVVSFESTMRKNPDFDINFLNSALAAIFVRLYSDSDMSWGEFLELTT